MLFIIYKKFGICAIWILNFVFRHFFCRFGADP